MLFTEKEFSAFRNFQNRLSKEFGETAYVGTDNAVVLVEYSPELKMMLRPYPPSPNFNFSLKHLFCEGCKKGQLFICLPTQEAFVCSDCFGKRRNKGEPKVVKTE